MSTLLAVGIFASWVLCFVAGYFEGRRNRNTAEGTPSASHNRQSMQCCAVCGYPLGSNNQCINGGCKACAD